MKRDKIKKILQNYYTFESIKSILCGRMKPSYKMMIKLKEQHNIPFEAWEDIKTFISKNIQKPKQNEKV
ncbi:hypothetical protein D3M61_07235 [Aliarcobacter butzleri]|uniref:hypothetical protein n=1 Tax=Aliarcobacter butzleri TaxID=28197 RepID=UPI0010DEF71D|nr:hypothetical protein [Aliarcobacter butzleri]RZV13668.1 hypothetical protein D3M61_07235 [Aliarcobacter butzleri]